jgi:hypothetical protein
MDHTLAQPAVNATLALLAQVDLRTVETVVGQLAR